MHSAWVLLYLCSSHCCIMCRRTLILRHHGDAKVEEVEVVEQDKSLYH